MKFEKTILYSAIASLACGAVLAKGVAPLRFQQMDAEGQKPVMTYAHKGVEFGEMEMGWDLDNDTLQDTQKTLAAFAHHGPIDVAAHRSKIMLVSVSDAGRLVLYNAQRSSEFENIPYVIKVQPWKDAGLSIQSPSVEFVDPQHQPMQFKKTSIYSDQYSMTATMIAPAGKKGLYAANYSFAFSTEPDGGFIALFNTYPDYYHPTDVALVVPYTVEQPGTVQYLQVEIT